jgi:glycosyltransferase involved in cell wall biosynthesis
MKQPLKVGFVSHSSGARGAEKALLEAIDALHNYPITSHVFVPGDGPLVDELRSLDIDYSFYTAVPWVTTRRTIWRSLAKTSVGFFQAIKLAKQLQEKSCQLVYSNSMAIATGAWAATVARLPHVWHIHEFGYEDHGLHFDLGAKVAKQVFQKGGGIFIVNSYVVADKLRQLVDVSDFEDKHRVIYQSVTIPPVRSVSVDKKHSDLKTLILVGALHKNKGQMDAVLAVNQLKKEGLELNLLLVGDGEFRSQLQQSVDELNLQDNVSLIGFVEDVSQWYAQADIVLVCSRREAFGRVAVEGMLSRKPVIVSNVGGLVEIVEDGVTGLHYEPGNIGQLADKIKLLLANQKLATEIAENGFALASSRFTKKRYGKDLYEFLAAASQNGAVI